jgi:hypothetical protein
MKNTHQGRNKDTVRRINKAAQRRYAAKQRDAFAPRSDDVARAILNVIRNERQDVAKAFPGGREVLLDVMTRASKSLLDRGFAPAEVRRKFAHVLRPNGLTTHEAEELARQHFGDNPEPTIRLSAKAARLEKIRAFCAGEIDVYDDPEPNDGYDE